MEVGYVYQLDAANPLVQSSRPFSILQAFGQLGYKVHTAFPLRAHSFADNLLKIAAVARGKNYVRGRHSTQARMFARQAQDSLKGINTDFVFSPSVIPLYFLKTSKPLVVSADASFAGMIDYYPEFTNLTSSQISRQLRFEQEVLRSAELVVYASDWAARTASEAYGLPSSKILVNPSGANFGKNNSLQKVLADIGKRPKDRIRLAFVGREWSRKGGDLVIATAAELNRRNIPTEAHIIGCTPVFSGEYENFVRVHGHLSPRKASDIDALENILSSSHLMMIPSRAEAYGMAFCEGNAFALPCIGTNTGGIETIVRNGVNGFLLPLAASASDYADRIERVMQSWGDYEKLAKASFDEFSNRLNWNRWATVFDTEIRKRLS